MTSATTNLAKARSLTFQYTVGKPRGPQTVRTLRFFPRWWSHHPSEPHRSWKVLGKRPTSKTLIFSKSLHRRAAHASKSWSWLATKDCQTLWPSLLPKSGPIPWWKSYRSMRQISQAWCASFMVPAEQLFSWLPCSCTWTPIMRLIKVDLAIALPLLREGHIDRLDVCCATQASDVTLLSRGTARNSLPPLLCPWQNPRRPLSWFPWPVPCEDPTKRPFALRSLVSSRMLRCWRICGCSEHACLQIFFEWNQRGPPTLSKLLSQ